MIGKGLGFFGVLGTIHHLDKGDGGSTLRIVMDACASVTWKKSGAMPWRGRDPVQFPLSQ
ncbi:hypothetical protein FSB08_16415 [Paraburkholderia sp. JPY432]|uniref:hypothetical protein n=1 Tax=Paraburkholderia youngii TaxID=2782701 RepID=UPI0015961A22|nr:hypothetical protein [Paraburkholderia youngii]NVH74112.1 hypothetical protein [Paraburkholderia youngii]